jgi:hypothetical protein
MTEPINLITTRRVAPTGELRGRPRKYHLDRLKVGLGKEVHVIPEEMHRTRERLRSSATNSGIKIESKYYKDKQILVIWRVE